MYTEQVTNEVWQFQLSLRKARAISMRFTFKFQGVSEESPKILYPPTLI